MRCFPALERTRTPEKDISFKNIGPNAVDRHINLIGLLYSHSQCATNLPASKCGILVLKTQMTDGAGSCSGAREMIK